MHAPNHAMFAPATVLVGALLLTAAPSVVQAEGSDQLAPQKAALKKVSKVADAPKVRPACKPSKSVLGVSRTITIDTKGGPKYGFVNYSGNDILKDKEVLLTYDDGPLPRYTNQVLKALEKECTRATFFVVGRMAMAFPKTVKRIAKEGHTLGTHTWSHGNLQRHNTLAAMSQIDRGVAAAEAAAGQKIAPVFRFPYLGRTTNMEKHLSKRNLAVFSIDIDSRDTRGYSPNRMISHTIARLKSRGKGIVLFHDIKRSTAAATGPFLRALRKNGFKIVHLKTSSYSPPVATLKQRYDAILDKRASKRVAKLKKAPKPFTNLPVRNTLSKEERAKAVTKSVTRPKRNPRPRIRKRTTAVVPTKKPTAAASNSAAIVARDPFLAAQ